MKRILFLATVASLVLLYSCKGNETGSASTTSTSSSTEATTHSQSGVVDETSQPNVVGVAVGSKDHTTLVAAVKAADLVNALTNAGPFTVFAPTNAAFDKLPAGTVDGLLKPEKKNDLIDILQYHVYVGVLKVDQLQDGQSLGMVNGANVKVVMVDGKPTLNGKAHIVASVPASNGIVHVIDEVLTPAK